MQMWTFWTFTSASVSVGTPKETRTAGSSILSSRLVFLVFSGLFTTSLILAIALVFFYFSVWEDFFWAFQLQNTELVHETILGRTMFYDVPCSGQREGASDRWGHFFFPSESMSDGFAQAPSASNGPAKLRTHSLCILCAPLQKLGGTA